MSRKVGGKWITSGTRVIAVVHWCTLFTEYARYYVINRYHDYCTWYLVVTENVMLLAPSFRFKLFCKGKRAGIRQQLKYSKHALSQTQIWNCLRKQEFGTWEGGTYNGLYREAPCERTTFFRLQVYKRVGISWAEVYERVGKSVI